MTGLYFEEYAEGMAFETGRKTVTDYDVSTFVNLAGLRGPMWHDLGYAKREEYYSGRLVPGMLVLSLAEGLIGGTGLMEDRGIALLEMTPVFKSPVLAGDTLQVTIEVTGTRLTSRGDRGIVNLRNVVRTDAGKTAVDCRVVRMIKGKAFVESGAE
jgi:acyl dehydratase